jgi:hypothetical protein
MTADMTILGFIGRNVCPELDDASYVVIDSFRIKGNLFVGRAGPAHEPHQLPIFADFLSQIVFWKFFTAFSGFNTIFEVGSRYANFDHPGSTGLVCTNSDLEVHLQIPCIYAPMHAHTPSSNKQPQFAVNSPNISLQVF